MNATFKKIASTAGKIGISLLLLGFLAYRAWQDPKFIEMAKGPKDWTLLAACGVLVWLAVTGTLIRWQMLARTLGLKLSLTDALRIGYLGYAVNLMPLGLVGGDALKAVFLARLNPDRKTEAVASVLVDRVIGLVALLVLAALSTFFFDIQSSRLASVKDAHQLNRVRDLVRILAAVSVVGCGALFLPGVTTWRIWDRAARIPVIGGVIRRLMDALQIYRGRADQLLLMSLMSLVIHTLYVGMVFLAGGALLLANGQPTLRPAFGSHFAFVPIAMAAGALPIGVFEGTLDLLYDVFLSPADQLAAANKGFLIAIIYRVLQILVAGVGLVYYLATRPASNVPQE